MFCGQCGDELPDETRFCPHCGHPQATTQTGASPPSSLPVADAWFPHFLRAVGVAFLVAASIYVVVGWVWVAHIYNRTGYRRRDVFLGLVPVVGMILHTRVMWRYTARGPYWTPRDDRPTDLLRGWQRPWAIGAGWVVGPLAIAAVVAAAVGSFDEGWTPEQRQDLVQTFQQQGFTRAVAECIVDEVIEEIPNANDFYEQSAIDDAVQDAVALCGEA